MDFTSKAKSLIDVYDADFLLLKELLEDNLRTKDLLEIRIDQIKRVIAAHEAVDRELEPHLPIELHKSPDA
jgi:hypothetical protein